MLHLEAFAEPVMAAVRMMYGEDEGFYYEVSVNGLTQYLVITETYHHDRSIRFGCLLHGFTDEAQYVGEWIMWNLQDDEEEYYL